MGMEMSKNNWRVKNNLTQLGQLQFFARDVSK